MSIKYTKELLEPIVKESRSIRQVILKLNLKQSGGTYSYLKKKIVEFGISTKHFSSQGWAKGTKSNKAHTVETFTRDVLCLNGKGWQSSQIKKKLFLLGFVEEKCSLCELGPIWATKFLSLHLDHINGNNRDNRIENLRILCPNCHSQTVTYAGKKNTL